MCIPLSVCGLMNGHHQELLGSTTTNLRGVAAFDFATVTCRDQFFIRTCGAAFDLLVTDVPYLVWVSAIAPIHR